MKKIDKYNSMTYLKVKKAVEGIVKVPDIAHEKKSRILVIARQVYMAITEEMLRDKWRYSSCGYYINRDHSDIVHNINLFRNHINDPSWSGFWIYILACEKLEHYSDIYEKYDQGELVFTSTVPFPWRYKVLKPNE